MRPPLLLPLPLLVLLAGGLAGQQARRPLRLDDPHLAASPFGESTRVRGEGDLRVAVWLDDRDALIVDDLFLAVSRDRGLTWDPEVRVTHAAATGFDADLPEVAVSGGRIHLCWDDDRAAGGDTTIHAFSDDLGATWNRTVLAHPTAEHRMAVEGDLVIIAYSLMPWPNVLFTVASRDGGVTFAPPIPVDPDNTGLYDVDNFNLSIQGGIGHLVWEDERNGSGDLFYSTSLLGLFWTLEKRIDQDPSGTGDIITWFTPFMWVESWNGTLHVAWMESGRNFGGFEHVLYYRRSLDNGAHFEPERVVGGYVPGVDDVDSAVMKVDGGLVALAWVDDRSGSDTAYATVSQGGGSFPPETPAPHGTSGPRAMRVPAILLEGGTVVLGWADDSHTPAPYDEQPWFMVSTDAGASWSHPVPLQPGAGADADVDLTADSWYLEDCSLNVAWQTDGGAARGDAMLAGGMRMPWVDLRPAGTDRVRLDLAGADPGYAGALARWAGSTQRGHLPNPDDPLARLGLGPSPCFIKSLVHAADLTATIDLAGTARTAPIRIPAGCPSGVRIHLQGWILQHGRAVCTSDVRTTRVP